MFGRRATALVALVASTAVLVSLSLPGSAGGGTVTYSIDAAAFVARDDTTHLDTAICDPVPSSLPGREFRGTMNGEGGFIASVNLPNDATITAFRLSARDNDIDLDAHAWLARKRLAPAAGLDAFSGYGVLAHVQSSGASTLLRRFTDSSIRGAVVRNAKFAYFVELVNCGDTVDPIGVQVVYRRP